MRKQITHIVGAGVSAGSGAAYAAVVHFPFGLQAIYFHTLAPIAGLLGHEFGRWLGTLGYKPFLLVILALLAAPLAAFCYDAVMHLARPSALNSLAVYVLFAAAVFSFAAALGIIGAKIDALNR